jgi:23S rRNA (uridine2552-2'-O)-methyltransferase
LKEADIKGKFDLVAADLSPKTCGIKSLDVAKSLELSKKAMEIAIAHLREGGNFVCKVFEGDGAREFAKEASFYFKFVKRFRPKAVRKESKEFYLVGKEFISKP